MFTLLNEGLLKAKQRSAEGSGGCNFLVLISAGVHRRGNYFGAAWVIFGYSFISALSHNRNHSSAETE